MAVRSATVSSELRRRVLRVKVGRNEPCPCGSGVKVKRCCGVDGARRSREAFGDLFGLAFHFPRQRPASATFDAWAERAPDLLSREVVEEGLAQLGAEECARIPAEFALAHPQIWEEIVNDARAVDDVNLVILVGAVVAGVEERTRELDAEALELLELDDAAREDPVESLALVLEAGDLWSVLEAIEASEAFDAGASLDSAATRLWSVWHEQRLNELVRRLGERLPVAVFPLASLAIENACKAFERDREVRARLRGELLLDALPTAFDALRLAA